MPTKKSSRPWRPEEHKSRVWIVVSDVHFPKHHVASWNAFKQFIRKVKPYGIVADGDIIDAAAVGRFTPSSDDPSSVIPEIQLAVRELNELKQHVSELIFIEGNHDGDRWARTIVGEKAQALKGAIGLTLRDQFYAQGLSKSVAWHSESVKRKDIKLGQFIIRHGHNQSGRFGGARHIAAQKVDKNLGDSEIFGHHHRAQLFCKSAQGRTAIGIANPSMTQNHEYAKDADWQRGFTVVELQAPSFNVGTAFPVIIQDGKFSLYGFTFNGN